MRLVAMRQAVAMPVDPALSGEVLRSACSAYNLVVITSSAVLQGPKYQAHRDTLNFGISLVDVAAFATRPHTAHAYAHTSRNRIRSRP